MTGELIGRIVTPRGVVPGRLRVEGELISEIEPDAKGQSGPYLAPGFIDLHVHGWGGHDAMAGRDALDGMARALLRRGVTSFLPTAVTAPLDVLQSWADVVRAWIPGAPADGATPLGFGLEGPFLSPERPGAHAAQHLRRPADVPFDELGGLVDGLRLTHVAPELPGALKLIGWLTGRGVVVALGHSTATLREAQAGYAAGATSTTHLFNAMSGVSHRDPGLAVAALIDDEVAVELIADGAHVDPALWPIVARAKPADRLLLVSDANSLAGTSDGRARLGGLEIEVHGERCTLVGTDILAGSVIALDGAVRNLVRAGFALPDAVAAAAVNPALLMGLPDRGRIEKGMRADIVELGEDLGVVGVIRGGTRLR